MIEFDDFEKIYEQIRNGNPDQTVPFGDGYRLMTWLQSEFIYGSRHMFLTISCNRSKTGETVWSITHRDRNNGGDNEFTFEGDIDRLATDLIYLKMKYL